MILERLLDNYTHFAGGLFFGLHVIVLVMTAALFAQFAGRANELARQIRGMGSVAEAEAERLFERLTEVEKYFDACTTAIILIGLAGTMYGFVQAVPHLRDPNYQLADLEQALSASAFGIFWALIVMLLVHAYRWSTVDGISEKLRKLQSIDPTDVWRELAKQTWQQVAVKIEDSATLFSTAADRIANAITQTSEDTRNSIEALHAARESAAKTANDVTGMLNAAMAMPETVGSKLDAIARDSAERLTATTEQFNQSLTRLEAIPARFRASFDELFTSHHAKLTSSLDEHRGAIEEMRRTFLATVEEFEARSSSGLGQIVSRFEAQIGALRDLPAQAAEALGKGMEAQLAAVRAAQELHRESIEQLQRENVKAFEQARTAMLEALAQINQTPQRMDEGLRQFGESQRGLFESMASDQRARIIELFNQGVLQMSQLEGKARALVEAYALQMKNDHDQLTARLQAVIPELVAGLVKEMREAAKPITESAEKMDAGFDNLFADAKRRLQDAVTASLNTVTQVIEGFREDLLTKQRELPDEIRTAQRDVIAKTVECAASVSRCADELTNASKSFPQTVEELRPQVHALNEAARRISNAAADFGGVFDRFFEPVKAQVHEIHQALTAATGVDKEADRTGLIGRLLEGLHLRRKKSKGRAKKAAGGEP